MARKKGGKKKKDSGKASLQKLESRLLGYWKRESWGEFVTLYQRHVTRAEKTQAAPYWNPAVYNLLVDTLFVSQDLALLQHVLDELIDPQSVSEENQKCLHTARLFLAAYNGQAESTAIKNLPLDLPAPFQNLAAAIDHINHNPSTSLSDYVQERRTKARKGEKHLALAARIGKQFNTLKDQDFQPSSVQPLTKLRKSLRDLQATLENQLGLTSPVVSNMSILADVMRTMYARPGNLIKSDQVLHLLHQEGFQTSSHPAVETMACGFLTLGRKRLGQDWEQSIRVALGRLLPGLAPELPAHLEKQLQSLRQVAEKAPPFFAWIPQLLKHDVWSARERTILLLVHLHLMANAGDQLLEFLEDMSLDSWPENQIMQFVNQFWVQAIQSLEQIIELHAQLGISDPYLLERATRDWQEAVSALPFDRSSRHLDQLLETMCSAPVPDAALLFAVMKRVEQARRVQGITSIAQVQKQRAPLQITEDKLRECVHLIGLDCDLDNVFQAWQACLTKNDYQKIVQLFLLRVFDETCNDQTAPDLLFRASSLEWADLDPSLLQNFAAILPPDFSLYGLVLLSVKTGQTDPPVPQNATQAQYFLDHLPPPQMLDEMLSWMLTWPNTPYRNSFLAAVIKNHVQYLTQNRKWWPLARAIQLHDLPKLAELVWDIWQELDLFSRLRDSQDFQSAREFLKPLAYKSKQPKGSSSRSRKQTLLDQVLEEKKKKPNKSKK
ncbi:MAG: hypothetical protein ACLFPB_04285 [Desulfovermiculus sp.]